MCVRCNRRRRQSLVTVTTSGHPLASPAEKYPAYLPTGSRMECSRISTGPPRQKLLMLLRLLKRSD